MRSLIIDCDTGADDAVAILMALACPEQFNILGICTVGGNAPLDLVTRNTLQVCALADQHAVKVYAGCPRPIFVPPINAAYAHGESGIDGADLPEPTMAAQKDHASDFYRQILKSTQEKITIVITGPMTNLAVALIQDPSIVDAIDRLVIMGGAIASGNITPSAEFNIYSDPHAASIVLNAGVPLTLLGLDVTHEITVNEGDIRRYQALNTNIGNQVAGILAFALAGDRERYGIDGRAVHDACTIAYLLRPDLFQVKPAHITVDTSRSETRGATAISFYPKFLTENHQSLVADQVDAPAVKELIFDLIAGLSGNQPAIGAVKAR